VGLIDTAEYFIGDELEPLGVWWTANGTLVDLSASTFTAKLIADADNSTAFTKTTGLSGSTGSGVKGDGTPNLTVSWATSGELNSVANAGLYILQIVAARISDGAERTAEVQLILKARF
jgi:hypothetical protein